MAEFVPKNGVGGGAYRTRKLGGDAATGVPSLRSVPAGRTKGEGPAMPWVKIVTTTNTEKERKASRIFDALDFPPSSCRTSSTLPLGLLSVLLLLLLLLLEVSSSSSSSLSLSSLSSQELVWRYI